MCGHLPKPESDTRTQINRVRQCAQTAHPKNTFAIVCVPTVVFLLRDTRYRYVLIDTQVVSGRQE